MDKNLKEWLDYIENIHPQAIDLSLDRIREVADKMGLLKKTGFTIIVAGTNGKGSTVETLYSILSHAGYRVGTYTSPHLFQYNERVSINRKILSDDAFCHAFSIIDKMRGATSLTFFEFGTLAALYLLKKQELDIHILEIGLGGRLDAVNIIDADIAIVTSIDLDHTDRLGKTRDAIAYEKAGIMRRNRPVICGDLYPPETLIQQAKILNAPLSLLNKDFSFLKNEESWEWSTHKKNKIREKKLKKLPLSFLSLDNMSLALMALELMCKQYPVSLPDIRAGIKEVFLPGRMQRFPGEINQLFDVAHNPAAGKRLAEALALEKGNIHAVFSMLKTKDIKDTIKHFKKIIHTWHIAALDNINGASIDFLSKCFHQCQLKNIEIYDSIKKAYDNAMKIAHPGDCVVVFGSFYTVAEVLSHDERGTSFRR